MSRLGFAPSKILVRMPNWIGDLVMATPVLRALKEGFPEVEITAMCLTSQAELFLQDPHVDKIWGIEKGGKKIPEKIKEERYEVGILLTNSFSSAWLLWRGGVPIRIGYSREGRRIFLTHPVRKKEEDIHQVDQYKRLLEPLGVSGEKIEPKLYVKEEEREVVVKLLQKEGYEKGQQLIGINPLAAYGPAKCWPEERYHQLLKKLQKHAEFFVVVLGEASSYDKVASIIGEESKNRKNFAGKTSLRELAVLMQEMDLLITNDSGPMHIAAALDTPLLALFGSTDEKRTGPYGKEGSVLKKKVSCSPCFQRVCPIDFRCMKGISVEAVYQKALQVLQRKKSYV